MSVNSVANDFLRGELLFSRRAKSFSHDKDSIPLQKQEEQDFSEQCAWRLGGRMPKMRDMHVERDPFAVQKEWRNESAPARRESDRLSAKQTPHASVSNHAQKALPNVPVSFLLQFTRLTQMMNVNARKKIVDPKTALEAICASEYPDGRKPRLQ